ncbi:hypothetical protein BU15DRAFT_65491 [Melanogaster broomeanus]|nr:hypothetical protein BU15DRAFT_65491 [Melanogaster broomeanus]
MAIAREEDEDVQMILTVIARNMSGAFQALSLVRPSKTFKIPDTLSRDFQHGTFTSHIWIQSNRDGVQALLCMLHKIAGDKCWAGDVLGMASARSTGEKSNARSITRFLSTRTNPRSVWNQNKRTLQILTKAALFMTLGSSIDACTAATAQSGRSFSSPNTPICYLLEKMPRGMPRGHDTTSSR